MKFIETGDRDILETRSGGGCLMLFGLPFLFAGLFVIGASLGLWAQKGNPPPWYFGVPFGGVFAAVGAAFVLGRGGIRLDRRNRKITSWWGLMTPFKTMERDLDRYDSVTVTKEIRRSKNSTYTVYPVRLCGEAKPINFEEPRNYGAARRSAEQVAKFVEMDIVDHSTGEAVRRAVGELDESLRDRLRRTDAEVEVPEPPPNPKTRYEIEGTRIVLHIPPEGLGLKHIAIGIFTVFWIGVVGFGFRPAFQNLWESEGDSRYVLLGILGFMVGVPLLILIGSIAASCTNRMRIVASCDGLEFHKRGKRVFISSDELEELVLPKGLNRDAVKAMLKDAEMPPAMKKFAGFLSRRSAASGRQRGIQARSDEHTVEFGKGLPDEELAWAYALLMRVVTS